MKEIRYRTQGVCAAVIDVKINDDGTIEDVSFMGGCDGNHKGITALCKGRQASEVAEKLKGITCGMKNTSCPDQLARAIESAE